MSDLRTLPHGFGVEVLVNPGTYHSRWRLDREQGVCDRLGDAQTIREEMIEAGWAADQTRIVAVTVVEL